MDLVEIRRDFHRHPELSGKEHRTAATIKKIINDHTPFKPITVAETGVMVHIEGSKEGPTTLFRGDIDALPIDENLDVHYNSCVAGVSHKCGHDGHTTVMLGLLDKLKKSYPKRGNCLILFQPAEEIGEGALRVLDDPIFNEFSFDFAFAFHNIPGESLGKVIVKEGAFSASVVSCAVFIEGLITHAAEPWKGRNPYVFIAKVYDYVKKINDQSEATDDIEVITPIYANLGKKAYGNSAGVAELHFTLRSSDFKRMNILVSRFQEFIHSLGKDQGLLIKEDWFESFHANENHYEAVTFVHSAANKLNMEVKELDKPYRWGEDFGILNKQAKGCMFGLGAGIDTPPLHDENYDFPDDLIHPAVNLFFEIKRRVHDDD